MKYFILLFPLLLIACSDVSTSPIHGALNETYFNENINIRMEYNSDWTIQEREAIILTSPQKKDGMQEVLYIYGINMGLYPITLHEYVNHSIKLMDETYRNFEHLRTEDLVLDGNDAQQVFYEYYYNDRPYLGYHTLLINQNIIYVISYASTDFETHKPYIDSIITALKYN